MGLVAIGANVRGLTGGDGQEYDFQKVTNWFSEIGVEVNPLEGGAHWQTTGALHAAIPNYPRNAASPTWAWFQARISYELPGTKNQLVVWEATIGAETLRFGFDNNTDKKLTIWNDAWTVLAQGAANSWTGTIYEFENNGGLVKVYVDGVEKVSYNYGSTGPASYWRPRTEVNAAGKGGALVGNCERKVWLDNGGSAFNQRPTTRFVGIAGLSPLSDDPTDNDLAVYTGGTLERFGDLWPDGTISNTNWTGTPLHEQLDEYPYEGRRYATEYGGADANVIGSSNAATTDTCVLSLRNWGLALTQVAIYRRVRVNAVPQAGTTITLLIELRKADDTVVTSVTHVFNSSSTTAWVNAEQAMQAASLTAAEVDGLKVRLHKTVTGGDPQAAVEVGQVGASIDAKYANVNAYGKAATVGSIYAGLTSFGKSAGDRQLFNLQDPATCDYLGTLDITAQAINAVVVKAKSFSGSLYRYVAREGGVYYQGPVMNETAGSEQSFPVWVLEKTPAGNPWTVQLLRDVKFGIEVVTPAPEDFRIVVFLDVEALYGGAGFDAPAAGSLVIPRRSSTLLRM